MKLKTARFEGNNAIRMSINSQAFTAGLNFRKVWDRNGGLFIWLMSGVNRSLYSTAALRSSATPVIGSELSAVGSECTARTARIGVIGNRTLAKCGVARKWGASNDYFEIDSLGSHTPISVT